MKTDMTIQSGRHEARAAWVFIESVRMEDVKDTAIRPSFSYSLRNGIAINWKVDLPYIYPRVIIREHGLLHRDSSLGPFDATSVRPVDCHYTC